MRIEFNLEKGLQNVIGLPIKVKDNTLGKVIEYDPETGLTIADVEFNSIQYDPIVGSNIGISSRNLNE